MQCPTSVRSHATPETEAATDLSGTALLDSIPAGIALLDADGSIAFVNEQWRRSFISSSDGCSLGENYVDLLQGKRRTNASAGSAVRAVLNGSSSECHVDYQSADDERWYRVRVSPRRDGQGGAVVMQREITDEKRQAAETERLVVELGERVKELNALHQVADLLRVGEPEKSEVLRRVAEIIPCAMQDPSSVAACVSYGGLSRSSNGYSPASPQELVAHFTTHDGVRGSVQAKFCQRVNGTKEHTFLPEERSLISSLAEMLRSHFDRLASERRLLEENESYDRQYAALVSLTSSHLWTSRDERAALQEFTETISRTLNVERVSLWRYNAHHSAIVCDDLFEASQVRHSSGQELQAAAYPSYFEALRENTVIAASEAPTDPRTCEFRNGYLDALGITSMLDAPILIGGRLAGVICIEAVGPCRTWSPGEQSFAVSVGHLISLFLAQRSLARSEARFASLFRGSPAAISINAVADGRYVEVNDSYCELIGYSREELQGKTSVEIGVWKELDRREATILRLLAEGSVRDIEATAMRKDGEVRDVRMNLELIDLPGEPAPVSIALITDITERRKAHEALKLSNERFTLLSKATNDAIWDLNLKTGSLWWNDGCEKLMGCPPEEVGHLDLWSARIHPEDRERVHRHLDEVLNLGGLAFCSEYRLRGANDEYAYVLDRGHIIRDAAGVPIRMIGAIADLTQRIKTRATNRRSGSSYRPGT